MKKTASFILGATLLLGGFAGFQPSALASSETNSNEISPYAIFSPDRCITVISIEAFGSGWYVNGNIFLDKAAKHGFFNPKVGDNVDIMVDSQNRVVGWKVNN
jgi:hypothetical protein